MYFNVCHTCGANLDPCESCDCEIELIRTRKVARRNSALYTEYERELEEVLNEQIEYCS